MLKKLLNYIKRNGIRVTMRRIYRSFFGSNNFKYQKWIKKTEPNKIELEEQKKESFEGNIKFSIIIPLYCTPQKYLIEMLDSVINQTYTNWELCLADGSGMQSDGKTGISRIVEKYLYNDNRIKYIVLKENKGISNNTNEAMKLATGDYIIFGDHDDVFAPNALFECAKVVNNNQNIDLIYSDEDKIDLSGKRRFKPNFKSDFNIDLLRSNNYICHLLVIKKQLVNKVGKLDDTYDGAQDHDYLLRCVEKTNNIYHIPKVLYHWRCHNNSTADNPESKLYAFEAGKKAIEKHYERVGLPATVELGQIYGTYHTIYHWKENPLVSIIIPNKDHVEDLDKCIKSIEEKCKYKNIEYIIIENNSCKETLDYYEVLKNKNPKIKVVYYKGEFNYSAINNYGVQYAKGEYLLLLNNDTEVINPNCIDEMLGYCMRSDVGIVGARLLYPDDTVQHAGVVIGFGGIAGHTFIGFGRNESGYFNRLICAQDYSAVTAACMMTKKSIYKRVGGLSEEFKVAFNDIDYCLKVRQEGLLVVYNPYAELYHFESKSRGLEDTPEKRERFLGEIRNFEIKWPEILKNGDPYYNCNLTLKRSDFSIDV